MKVPAGFDRKWVIWVIFTLVMLSILVPFGKAQVINTAGAKAPAVKTLVINEFYVHGTAENEWVELYNPSDQYANYTDLKIGDQDGLEHEVNISEAGITSIPPGAYLVIYFGRGVNDTNFANDNLAVVYGWLSGDILNDDGDDILLYNGTYDAPGCQYIDYVAYYNGGPDFDIDQPPIGSGLKFHLYGRGAFGYIPAPGKDESASLVPNGQDNDNATDWYITRYIDTTERYDYSITPGLPNANILQVVIKDIAPLNQTQGTEKAVLSYTMIAIGGNIEIYKTFLKLYGTIEDNELVSGLYLDNGDGVWDVGDQAQSSYVPYSGHATSFSTPNTYVQIGRPKTFFVTVKLTDTASIFHNYSLQLTDMDTGTWSDNVHTNEVYIIESIQTKYVKISPIDQVPPYVVNVTFDRDQPLGPGSHTMTIEFDESMDTSIQPKVTYGLYGYEYNITGDWVTDKVWSGQFDVDVNGPHGKMTLLIKGAKDVFWNNLTPYVGYFLIDTEKPHIVDLKYNHVSPYPIGFPVNITVVFSENVTGVQAMIERNNKPLIIVDVHRYNGTVYYLSFITQSSWRQNEYTLVIYNATDIAGNVMNDVRTNFTVDVTSPTISYVDYRMNVVEGENITFYVYATDNLGIKRVWATYEYRGQIITVDAMRMGDMWVLEVVGGAVKPGEIKVTIYAEDMAGNVVKDEEYVTVIPWWQAMWWLWVIIAIIIAFIIFLIYDYVRRMKLREQLGEELVAESIVARVSKKLKGITAKKPKKKSKKKKTTEEEEEEVEEYLPPGSIPTIPETPPPEPPPVAPKESKEIPEVPYEEEYFEEETVERED